MRMFIFHTLATAALCAGWSATQAAEPFTANTLRLEEGEASPAASIDVMAWLAGVWGVSGLDSDSEEIWSAPRNGVMMGMYRMLRNGRPVLYEFLTLAEIDGSLVLRFKHFHPDMRGWEDRDEFVAFPLVAVQDGRIYFEGMTFEPRGHEVAVYIVFENHETGSVREEVFRYRRKARMPQ